MGLCGNFANWRTAVVFPLLKKTGLDLVYKNFRSVSNLLFISEVVEKAALQQLLVHCEKNANLHIFKQKFKCVGHTIKSALSKNYFVFSFDLKAVYHHVDIFQDHRKYLVFSWDFGTGVDRYFQFTVLPFGLYSAPFIFTKLLN